MRIHIVAGGPKNFIPDLNQYKEGNILWIGVDRGVRYLLNEGIVPQVAIGDFDSISEEDFHHFETQLPKMLRFQPEKDETDMELALRYAVQELDGPISIFGATGGRLDHLLANVFLLKKAIEWDKERHIQLIDTQNVAEVRRPGIYTIKEEGYTYISFIPLSPDIRNLNLKGFKYPLIDSHILFGSTLCISNELISDIGTYSFSEGILLVIKAKDD